MGMLKLGKYGIETPAICGSVIGPDVRTMRAGVAKAIAQGADLVELRIDGLRNPADWGKILPIALPPILTNRPEREGGWFKGEEEERVEFLLDGIARGVACIDIELSTEKSLREEVLRRAKEKEVGVLISHHEFSSTPPVNVLMKVANRMASSGCDLMKLVTFAQRVDDSIRVLDFLVRVQDEVSVPVIAFAMGEAGKLSRIAAPLMGSPIVYAAAGKASAPGQLSVNTCKKILQELMPGEKGWCRKSEFSR